MATANISWTACGSAAIDQSLYYGSTLIATGTPISGTGWSLYSGSTLANSVSSATIPSLNDNVDYTFYVYCNCTTGGGPLSTVGPLIKNVCPTAGTLIPTYNGLSYIINVPSSANNAGTWIQTIVVSILNSSGTTTLQSTTFNAPFNSTLSSNFTGLNAATNYSLAISYGQSIGSRINNCGSTPFTTAAACTTPTITVSNITSTTFNVSWTPTTGGSFDVLVNGSAVATGLTSTNGTYTVTGLVPSTIYQVAVRLNCTTGGTGISSTQNVTTTNANVNGVMAINRFTGTSQTEPLTMSFTFPTATTFPITIYFGQVSTLLQSGGGSCVYAEGYDLFSVPSGTCAGGPAQLDFGPSGNMPWVINIPQGTTTYTTAQNSIYTSAGPGPNIGSGNPGGYQYAPWSMVGGFLSQQFISKVYMHVNSPSGYSANFTIANGMNTSGILLYNV